MADARHNFRSSRLRTGKLDSNVPIYSIRGGKTASIPNGLLFEVVWGNTGTKTHYKDTWITAWGERAYFEKD